MVPVNALDLQQHIDTLRQSIDLNVRDLIEREDMPLPLAVYLWCVRRHRIPIVNGDILAQWGVAWVRRVLIDRDTGTREDEEVSAAALAAVALQGAPELLEMEDDLRTDLKRILSANLERSLVPYRRPAYAAVLVLAAVSYSVANPPLEEVVRALTQGFIRAMPGGRLFGVGFLMELLCRFGDDASRDGLRAALLRVATNASSQYEDRIYALHALWLEATSTGIPTDNSNDLVGIIEKELRVSPGWSFVMMGDETVPPAGAREDRIPLSPLYRGILLDLALGMQEESKVGTQARIDATYRGDQMIIASAFALWSLTLLAPTVLMFAYVGTQISSMYRYFILHEFDGVQVTSAICFAIALVGLGYLVPFAAITIRHLWQLMIVRTVQSDRRAQEIIRESALAVLKPWLYIVVGVVGTGLLVSLLYPAVAHMLGSK